MSDSMSAWADDIRAEAWEHRSKKRRECLKKVLKRLSDNKASCLEDEVLWAYVVSLQNRLCIKASKCEAQAKELRGVMSGESLYPENM